MEWNNKKHKSYFEAEATSEFNPEITYRVNRNLADEEQYSLYIHDIDDLICFTKGDDPDELKHLANKIDLLLL